MIKVYCDKCGKEIVGNAKKVIEETEAFDVEGKTVVKFQKVEHICDKCQYKDLTCGFNVGDIVITDDGRVGTIRSICDCDSCKKRGFYEPNVEMKLGEQVWITDTDKHKGFDRFYKIGSQVFGNIDEQYVLDCIQRKKELIHDMQMELATLEDQLNVIHKLKK